MQRQNKLQTKFKQITRSDLILKQTYVHNHQPIPPIHHTC